MSHVLYRGGCASQFGNMADRAANDVTTCSLRAAAISLTLQWKRYVDCGESRHDHPCSQAAHLELVETRNSISLGVIEGQKHAQNIAGPRGSPMNIFNMAFFEKS
jgi:hypothetical protein